MASLLRYLLLAVVAFSYLKPAYFDVYGFSLANAVFNYLRIVAAVGIVATYLLKFRGLSRLVIVETLTFGSYLLSTVYNGQDVVGVGIFSISCITFTMLVEICANKHSQAFLKTFYFSYIGILVFNISMMYATFGVHVRYEDWYPDVGGFSFVSSDNLTASYIFPAICIAMLLRYRGGRFSLLFPVVMVPVLFLNAVSVWSATSLLGLVILTVVPLLPGQSLLRKYIGYKTAVLAAAIVLVGVTFFRVQNLFEYLIVEVLQKDLSMTGRVYFWDYGLGQFYKNPILGCGWESLTIDNGPIQILFYGGVLSLLFSVLAYIVGTAPLGRASILTRSQYYLILVCATILLMSAAESWNHFFGLYVILAIASVPAYAQELHGPVGSPVYRSKA